MNSFPLLLVFAFLVTAYYMYHPRIVLGLEFKFGVESKKK